MNAAKLLWDEQFARTDYPTGVLRVPTPIEGTAFFPGGFGLFNSSAGRSLPSFPHGGVMVLGHDFHSETEYRRSLQRGCEATSQPTWRNLLALLTEAEIPPSTCFFTNFFLGLRRGGSTTGIFPGASDASFVHDCREFALRQLDVQRPRLVLTLGIQTPYLIAPMSPELAAWGERRGLKHLDARGPLRFNVTFGGLSDYRTTVVALTHPSLRNASVRHRRFEGATGAEAEFKMLAAAKAVAGAFQV